MKCEKCRNYSDENDFCVAIGYSAIEFRCGYKNCGKFEEGMKSAEVIIGEIETRLMVERGWIS